VDVVFNERFVGLDDVSNTIRRRFGGDGGDFVVRQAELGEPPVQELGRFGRVSPV
jgi:hypothetical protein